MLSILDTHPTGWTNPVNARPSALLTASFVSSVEFSVSGAQYMTLSFSYTRGAAGGAFDWRLQSSLYSVAGNVPTGAGEWSNQTAYLVGDVVSGDDTQSLVQGEYVTYESDGATIETFVVGPIQLNATVERMRIQARESGVVGTPGTLQISAEMWK